MAIETGLEVHGAIACTESSEQRGALHDVDLCWPGEDVANAHDATQSKKCLDYRLLVLHFCSSRRCIQMILLVVATPT